MDTWKLKDTIMSGGISYTIGDRVIVFRRKGNGYPRQQITKKNYPNTIHIGDVRDVKGSDLPEIDLLIGGSPCQSFSNAGNGKGFEGCFENTTLPDDRKRMDRRW
jgi:hypothetical protein